MLNESISEHTFNHVLRLLDILSEASICSISEHTYNSRLGRRDRLCTETEIDNRSELSEIISEHTFNHVLRLDRMNFAPLMMFL